MTKAVQIRQTSGPNVMQLVDVNLSQPGPSKRSCATMLLALSIDVYFRAGCTRGSLPSRSGHGGAGVVEAVGPGVASHVKAGDRVAYASRPMGSVRSQGDAWNCESKLPRPWL